MKARIKTAIPEQQLLELETLKRTLAKQETKRIESVVANVPVTEEGANPVREWPAILLGGHPVDAMARRVMGHGVVWTKAKVDTQGLRRFEYPPKVVRPPKVASSIGRRFGRLVALGILHSELMPERVGKSTKPAPWVCRCDCGAYETFRWRSLHRGTVTMCSHCEYTDEMLKGKLHVEKGKVVRTGISAGTGQR